MKNRVSLLGVPGLILVLLLLTPSVARGQAGIARVRATFPNGKQHGGTAINAGPHPTIPDAWTFLSARHIFDHYDQRPCAHIEIRGQWVKATQVTQAPDLDLMVLTCHSNLPDLRYVVPAFGYTGDATAAGYPGGNFGAFEGHVYADGMIRFPKRYVSNFGGISGGGVFPAGTDGLCGIIEVSAVDESWLGYTDACACARVLEFAGALPRHWRNELHRCGGRPPAPDPPVADNCPDPQPLPLPVPEPPTEPHPHPHPSPQPTPANFVTVHEFRHSIEEIKALISQVQVIQGPPGDDGKPGPPGRGIDNVWLIDNRLWVRYSDSQEICLGEINVPAASVDVDAIVQQVLARVKVPQVDTAAIVAQVLARVKVPKDGEDGKPGRVNVIIQDSGEEVGRYDNLESGTTVVVDIERFLKQEKDNASHGQRRND